MKKFSVKDIVQVALILLALYVFVYVAFPIHFTGRMTAQERELEAKKLQLEKQLAEQERRERERLKRNREWAAEVRSAQSSSGH